jgi:hypothetical protein
MQWLFGSCRFQVPGQERICTYLTSSVPLSRLRIGQLAGCFDLRIILRPWMVYIRQVPDFIVGSLEAPGRVYRPFSRFSSLFCIVEQLVSALPVYNSCALLKVSMGRNTENTIVSISRLQDSVQTLAVAAAENSQIYDQVPLIPLFLRTSLTSLHGAGGVGNFP